MSTDLGTAPWPTAPAPIDPFAPTIDGCYGDEAVTVARDTSLGAREVHTGDVVRTPHFDVWSDGRLHVRHRLDDDRIDDAITGLLNTELFEPGWVSGNQIFERIFTGIVLTSRRDPLDAWALFYRNTMAGIAQDRQEFSAIYRRADTLVPDRGSVLELGACFGFLSLHLAARSGRRVIASDIAAGSMRLLAAVAPRLAVPLSTEVFDAARVSLPDRSVDTVLLVHLLEHVDADHGARCIAEAQRVAARRVVIAVPYESEPNAAYGHVRTITHDDLDAWGRAGGWAYSVADHHGGWLVLDRT